MQEASRPTQEPFREHFRSAQHAFCVFVGWGCGKDIQAKEESTDQVATEKSAGVHAESLLELTFPLVHLL